MGYDGVWIDWDMGLWMYWTDANLIFLKKKKKKKAGYMARITEGALRMREDEICRERGKYYFM